jgi:hypothetical protein
MIDIIRKEAARPRGYAIAEKRSPLLIFILFDLPYVWRGSVSILSEIDFAGNVYYNTM